MHNYRSNSLDKFNFMTIQVENSIFYNFRGKQLYKKLNEQTIYIS